jgi:DNA polymerase-3 subunit epsilon
LARYQETDLKVNDEIIEKPVRNDMMALHEFTNDPSILDVTQRLKYDPEGEIIFNFGRYQGSRVKEVLRQDRNYCHWILNKEFSVQVKNIVRKVLHELDADDSRK